MDIALVRCEVRLVRGSGALSIQIEVHSCSHFLQVLGYAKPNDRGAGEA